MHQHHSDGFTLTEMLVVISIIIMVMGIGTAFVSFSQSKYQLQATANGIISTLRNARSEAMSSGSPVQVEFQKPEDEKGQIISYAEMEVASWEFDEKEQNKLPNGDVQTIVPGSFGQPLKCGEQVAFALGTVGGAVAFQDAPNGRSNRNTLSGRCEHPLNLNHRTSQGFIIRFSYWTGEISDEVVLMAKNNLFSIGLTKKGQLAASIGKLGVASKKPSPPATWHDVRITFQKGRDGPDRLTIHQNGQKIGETVGDATLNRADSDDATDRFRSDKVQLGVFPNTFSRVRLDRLRYTRIIQEQRGTIPKPVLLRGDNRILFHPDGTTDPKHLDLSRKGIDRALRIRVLPTGGIEQIARNKSTGSSPSTAPAKNRTPSSN